jgi:NAD(P)-dependent dehydrogenase (short-subunit alcohol dehydrogenase family)
VSYVKSEQKPIDSGFNFKSTAEDVIAGHDLSGKIAIVTGGYSGIGLETTRVLALAGAHVVVPARDIQKAREAVNGIAGVELAQLDLMDPASIDAFAEQFLDSKRPLHILVNNAGIMAVPLVRDSRGYESQFATNHLGHFQLTARLWAALVQANGARVISVSSRGHRFSGVDFDDWNFERRPYDKWVAYGQSKTANILFAVSVDARGYKDGVRAFSLHPGRIIDTALARHMAPEELRAAVGDEQRARNATNPADYMKTIPEGAATSVWCATSRQLAGMGGVYCEDCNVAPVLAPGADESALGVRAYAVDPEFAERLWTLSLTLTATQPA